MDNSSTGNGLDGENNSPLPDVNTPKNALNWVEQMVQNQQKQFADITVSLTNTLNHFGQTLGQYISNSIQQTKTDSINPRGHGAQPKDPRGQKYLTITLKITGTSL